MDPPICRNTGFHLTNEVYLILNLTGLHYVSAVIITIYYMHKYKRICISAPEVAREIVFRSATGKAHFACFDAQNRDIYNLFRRGMCGGPAIVFHLYHERHKTFIRNNESKPCKKIVGYDANALYLWALKQDMPTGRTVHHQKTRGQFSASQARSLSESFILLRMDKAQK